MRDVNHASETPEQVKFSLPRICWRPLHRKTRNRNPSGRRLLFGTPRAYLREITPDKERIDNWEERSDGSGEKTRSQTMDYSGRIVWKKLCQSDCSDCKCNCKRVVQRSSFVNAVIHSCHGIPDTWQYILYIHAVSATYFPDDFIDVNKMLKSPSGLYVEIIPVQKQILQNLGWYDLLISIRKKR
jgi:hypothetical protein